MSKVSKLSKVTTPSPGEAPAATFDATELLKSLPHRPGVYRMFDAEGRVLYVGKARDLKKRRVAILDGIAAGEQVVVSGQFLLDSEANLRSGLGRLQD